MSQENKWELVTRSSNNFTERLKVDGGWIYVVNDQGMVFVPDVDLQRYQAHLRDAYKQGYEDGHRDAKHGVKQEL